MTTTRLFGACAALTLAAGCHCGGGALPTLPEKIVGACTYTNSFSKSEECRDYLGEWSDSQASEDCKDWSSTVQLGTVCNYPAILGYCVLTVGEGRFTRISLPGTDGSKCGSSKRGCELFGGGTFDPSPVCGGLVDDTGSTGLPTFQQPERSCRDPLAGEDAGTSPNGQICTWEAISGATEAGRHFDQYASCDRVRTQRPYYPAAPAPDAERADERMNDPTYLAEQSWVRSQIESTACVCCHSTRAPDGSSNWFVESKGNFINSFNPRGLAMGAGWVNSVGFGAYPIEQNNGFSRSTPDRPTDSIFVTQDPARMARFFEAELAHRGIAKAQFEGTYGAGPLDDQRFFVPKACENGEGVDAQGRLIWRGGKARYVYVLEQNATSPTVPPNLDLPMGLIWRLDVPADGTPVTTGQVTFGTIPPGLTQRYPEAAAAPLPLVSGQTYYLYVTADVVQPITRCLFVAP